MILSNVLRFIAVFAMLAGQRGRETFPDISAHCEQEGGIR